ncbi:oligosaccharide flippase family protein [uncultured Clostridium sp.]|uniref:oligosaccharide flippase family protein n=1 Tax=uncultured Clostridium sp. TaxID=59620 RepID=UPI002639963E|nr:oligosaccharide flippase family protein [uncultured Clostridium sp.]
MQEKSLYKNSIFRIVLNLFKVILPILIGPYVMRVLLPEQIGDLNYAQSISSYFLMFGAFGIFQYGVREISKIKHDKEAVSSKFTSFFIITLISNLLALVIFVLVLTVGFKGTNVYWICMILNIPFLFNVFQIDWMNEALENFGFITLKTIVVRGAYFIAIIVLVRNPSDFKTYVYLNALVALGGSVFSFLYIKRNVKFSFKNLKFAEHIIPMFFVVIISNANVLYTQSDVYMLGYFSGGVILSYYVVGMGIMGVLNTFMMSVVQAIAPRLHSYIEKEDKTDYLNLLNKVTKIYFMLIFPAVMGMILFSTEILTLYAGSQYTEGFGVIACFGIYMITLAYGEIASNQVLYVYRKERNQVAMLFTGGFINIVLNIILIYTGYFSVNTSILSTGVANIFVIMCQYLYITKVLKIKIELYGKAIYKYLVVSLIFIPIVYGVKYIVTDGFIELIIASVICGGVYFLILLIIKDDSFLVVANPILSRIKSKLGK